MLEKESSPSGARMQLQSLISLVLVIADVMLSQAFHTGKDPERSRERDSDVFETLPTWSDMMDFRTLPNLKNLHVFKDMHNLKELHNGKEFTGFKDPDTFKNLFSLDVVHPETTYTSQMMPNKGKDIKGEESKREADFAYQDYDDYEGDYYADRNYDNHHDDQDGEFIDLSYLSFMDKELLKSVGSIEEVARIAGSGFLDDQQDYPEAEHGLVNSALRVRSGHTRGNENGPKMAQRATCEPEKVSIPLEAVEGYHIIPTCVRVKRCGGCCNEGMECVVTKTKPLNLKVLELSIVNENMRWKVLHNVTEDMECGCQCSVQREDCLPTQEYNRDTCSCLCKAGRESVKRECEENHRLWDHYHCQCLCPLNTPRSDADCGSGQKFNSLSCSCEND